MSVHDLKFSETSSFDVGSYKLMELPPDLYTLIENATGPVSFTIKGKSAEDAVLCTSDRTYAVRSVVLSNSVLVITPDEFEADTVLIRDELHEILELQPAVPKLHKLGSILRGRVYDEGQDEEEEERELGDEPSERRGYTYADAEAEIQASSAELEQALKSRHILILNNELRPIAPSHLLHILQLILNALVQYSQLHDYASVETILTTLTADHDVPSQVTSQIMSWFGKIVEGRWAMNVKTLVKQIGLGVLAARKEDQITEPVLLKEWKTAVGDTFESNVAMDLLSGNYLVNDSTLKYFPAKDLPVEPSARFADLFLTRARWKVNDLTPFLSDIAVNNKERDKLLLKHARSTTDSEGVWYTARNIKYNG